MSEGAQIVKPTIAQIFSELLAEQERRLSGRSLSQYGQVVPIQNLKPQVLMMEPAEDWYRCNAAELLRPAKIWSVLI